MNITCGKEIIDISKISYVAIEAVSKYELEELEQHYHGDYPGSLNSRLRKINSIRRYYSSLEKSEFCEKLEASLNKYWYEIGLALTCPKTSNQARDNWTFAAKKQSFFSVGCIDSEGDAIVKWEFKKDYGVNAANYHVFGTEIATISLANEVMPVIYQLANKKLQKKKNTKATKKILSFLLEMTLSPVDAIYHDDSRNTPEEMQSELKLICSEYEDIYGNIRKEIVDNQTRLNKREEFLKKYANKSILVVIANGEKKKYLEEHCGFDIYEKETEIKTLLTELKKHNQKVANSDNAGEKQVEYVIKWFASSNPESVISIKSDCESRYRFNCILLNNPDFVDEPQEYDHILVCSSGIIIIETKHWKDKVEIRSDGKWTKEIENKMIGIESPKLQMRRHEILMKNILPSVSVHSLLCFSHPEIIIEGKENFKEYKIINIEQLEEALSTLCLEKTYTLEDMKRMATIIDSHKINVT